MDPLNSPLERDSVSGGRKRQTRRSGPRRKTGCYTCKARHASCDEKNPVCGNCERLSLHCRPFEFIVRSTWCLNTETAGEHPPAEAGTEGNDGDSTTSLRPGTSHRKAGSVSSVFSVNGQSATSPSDYSMPSSSTLPASSPLAAAKPIPLPLNVEAAYLLSVYTTGVATWMDVFDHSRSYQLEVPRRCLTSALLRRCVCAFTAKQLSLLPSGEIWSVPAVRYYGSALRLLIQHLDSNPGSSQGDALTANMLLSSYEMLDAHGHEHQRHLHGALTLVRMQGINAQCQGMDRANFWIYVRHDITIALEKETALQLSPKDWNVEWRHGEAEADEDVLANQLMWLVARAIDFVYAPDPPSSPNSVLQDIQSEAAAWLDNLPVSFLGVKYSDSDDLGLVKTYFAVPTAGK
ncbi:hypothetical protein QBC46DRAFT_360656 [Diplogelasinospora grovesii]|uniref:Zn(2)-C6 fungal-type domain-containing protein n=1 Tax=Diplogelasinospora grovesii TaxID=303347 RepID=A0AAN6NFZ5_9PEZI|nr:hypothetical protein QBC46DRAFT_360656 [Diplogelasinospora grovesii]